MKDYTFVVSAEVWARMKPIIQDCELIEYYAEMVDTMLGQAEAQENPAKVATKEWAL